MKTHQILLLIFGFLLYSKSPFAGSTSYYHPTSGIPLQWETDENSKATIHYIVDAGGLGRLTHGQALQLLQAAMAIWEEAANIDFVYDGDTEEAITFDNYTNYLVVNESIANDSSTLETVENEYQFNRISVIGFDNTNREILNDADGLAGDGSVFGRHDLTSISGTNDDPQFITSAQIIFDGQSLDGITNDGATELSINAYLSIIVHELGHLIGLDHSSVNETLNAAIASGELDEETYARYVPTMDANQVLHEDRATLNPDDIAAAQALYPFNDSPTAIISGNVADSDSIDFRGAQVELRNTEDPLCEVFAFESGKQCTPLVPSASVFPSIVGSVCGIDSNIEDIPDDASTNTGRFFLRAIPSGAYVLSVQEVIDDYKGGVIHPFTTEFPMPELFGQAEFYNNGDTADEPFDARTTITVIDGEDQTDLNIILSSNVPDGDGEENLIPIDFFSTANGFTDSLTVTNSRCQPNTVDYAALIGVEELVGTDDGNDNDSDTGDTSSASSAGCSLLPL